MHREFYLDVERIRAQGLCLSVGKRLTRRRLLRLKGHEQIAKGLSDPASLAEFTEVEIVGLNGAPSLFILVESLLHSRQVILGFHVSGCPILLGCTKAMPGHILTLGLTQSGVVVEDFQDLIAR